MKCTHIHGARSKSCFKFIVSGDHPPNVNTDAWSIKNTIRMYFPITLGHPENDFNKELKISSAKLRVNIIKTFPDNLVDEFTVDQIIRVNLYQVLSIHNATKYKRTLLDSKLIDLTRPWSESFELQKAVQSWTNDHTANMGIELAVDSQDINDLIQIEMPDHMKTELNASISGALPTLVVYAQEREILKRVKRGSSKRGDKCKRKAGETKCCRYSININFAEIGWDDWIIAPSGYKGFYCAGECPYGHKMANNFAGIKALLHLKNPAKVPSPCCVATKLKPLTILHYDHEGKYRFTEYEDMIVTQCKCG
ncbi:hypothetical protein DPMN_082430 [Dreissena polymorpha]|uniref:TGF-beta family profile domain-containing protein n=1 Tax=Dreissena polymorpha TaxID=45954 RepID=A0A9D3Y6Y6_DREPO|nr:hypothetical protein DPMN_082430 [Dreissena polymorpha]